MEWQYQLVYESGVREVCAQRNIGGERFVAAMAAFVDEQGVVPEDAEVLLVNENDSRFVTPC